MNGPLSVVDFDRKMRTPTTPPHGGAERSGAKITNALACHRGPAVRLGHPPDRSYAATYLYGDSRAKTLSAPAPRRPFGQARLHGRTHRSLKPVST